MKELGYAQLQANRMERLISSGDLPRTLRPEPISVSTGLSQKQRDEVGRLNQEIHLIWSNLAKKFANDDVAKANTKIEDLVNQTTRFLREAADITTLGRKKLAQEWDNEQKRVVENVGKMLKARMAKDEKSIADSTLTCTTDSLSPAHSTSEARGEEEGGGRGRKRRCLDVKASQGCGTSSLPPSPEGQGQIQTTLPGTSKGGSEEQVALNSSSHWCTNSIYCDCNTCNLRINLYPNDLYSSLRRCGVGKGSSAAHS